MSTQTSTSTIARPRWLALVLIGALGLVSVEGVSPISLRADPPSRGEPDQRRDDDGRRENEEADGRAEPLYPESPCRECDVEFLRSHRGHAAERREALERYRECRERCGAVALPRASEVDTVEALPWIGAVVPELYFAPPRVAAGRLEVSVHVDTDGGNAGFTELAFGVSTVESDVLTVESIVAGDGLTTYAVTNGDPPECDVVVYPGRQAAVGSITKLFDAVPYDSEVHGTELLRITYRIDDTAALETSLQVFTSEELRFDASTSSYLVTPSELASSRLDLTPPPRFVRGDSNGDGRLLLADAITTLEHLFSGTSIACADAADLDDDGEILIADAIGLLEGLFLGTRPLDPDCVADASFDEISCSGPGC